MLLVLQVGEKLDPSVQCRVHFKIRASLKTRATLFRRNRAKIAIFTISVYYNFSSRWSFREFETGLDYFSVELIFKMFKEVSMTVFEAWRILEMDTFAPFKTLQGTIFASIYFPVSIY